jgi:uncharacterized membrane protein YgcG
LISKLTAVEPQACRDCEINSTMTEACHMGDQGIPGSRNARDNCLDMPGIVMQGMYAGRKRSDVCIILLTCMRESRCYSEYNLTDCACGKGVQTDLCWGAGSVDELKGACVEEALGAAEVPVDDATPVATMLTHWNDYSFPVGRAGALVELCDYTDCAKPCGLNSGEGDNGAAGMSGSGGAGGMGGSGGAAGLSGSGGAAGLSGAGGMSGT